MAPLTLISISPAIRVHCLLRRCNRRSRFKSSPKHTLFRLADPPDASGMALSSCRPGHPRNQNASYYAPVVLAASNPSPISNPFTARSSKSPRFASSFEYRLANSGRNPCITHSTIPRRSNPSAPSSSRNTCAYSSCRRIRYIQHIPAALPYQTAGCTLDISDCFVYRHPDSKALQNLRCHSSAPHLMVSGLRIFRPRGGPWKRYFLSKVYLHGPVCNNRLSHVILRMLTLIPNHHCNRCSGCPSLKYAGHNFNRITLISFRCIPALPWFSFLSRYFEYPPLSQQKSCRTTVHNHANPCAWDSPSSHC